VKKNPVFSANAAELRRLAEERLKKKQRGYVGKGAAPVSAEETQRLIQELQIHQIELEMQNEELRQARVEVEAGLALYTELYDFAPVGYFTLSRDGIIRRANLTGALLLGMERGRLVGRRFGHFVSGSDRIAFNAFLAKVFTSREKGTCEAALRKEEKRPPPPKHSGSRRFGGTGKIIVHIEAIASEDGQECRAVVTDVTERKQAEEQLLAALHEKDTLLMEIHHRVKNNLQMVSSLLNLQSGYLKDAQAIEVFNESRSRVNMIALVHTKLYQSKHLTAIDYADFIEDLASSLLQTYGREAAAIKIRTDARDIFLDVGLAIPCGLIVNELITNALKHAFLEKREGEIRVGLRENGGRYILTVMDSGAGFPEEVDFRDTASLGLQLVNILVKQLRGTIALEVDGGTTFVVSFPTKGSLE